MADRTGLHPRWLREWLFGNAAADLLASDDGERFEPTAVGAMVLSREGDSLRFAAGAFGPPPDPALEGVHDRLAAGTLAADVGCGAAVALTTLAEAYPRSTFHGYELSRLAVERARARVGEAGLAKVEIIDRRAEDLPAGSDYSLVLTFDYLHDMTRPDVAAAAIRQAIVDDGTWLVKEVRCADAWAGNRRNPMLATFLGFSIASCMSSALSEPGGAGHGTIGLPPRAVQQLAPDAGFTKFKAHNFEDRVNLYYEIRP